MCRRQPGLIFRGMVLLGQGVIFNAYMLAYILSPKTCHSFVGVRSGCGGGPGGARLQGGPSAHPWGSFRGAPALQLPT